MGENIYKVGKNVQEGIWHGYFVWGGNCPGGICLGGGGMVLKPGETNKNAI